MVFDYYGDLESEKNFIVFSSNSAYAGFSGWNEQELSEYNLKDYSYYSYYWNDTHMLILNQVFSFGPFEMVEKEGVIESQKGIFQKDVTGNPDFNKPVSLKFDISKRTTISGSLKNKTIKINNLLPKERIKSILTYVWDELLNEKNDYYYSVYYYNGKNNSELKIYLSYDLQSLYVDGRTKQVDRTMIWMTKNGDLEIYNEYIKTFNESANFLNETYTYIEWDTGYANDKLKDLFYMENDGDFLSLNLDNSSPAGNGKPISHIICNGKSHPVVDADAIVYEEVE